MAPIKFEEQIKQKLEARNIAPSETSWEQLSAQLHTEKRNKSKKVFWTFGVAASIVGIILVTTLFFKTSETESTIPTLVESENSSKMNIENASKEIENNGDLNVSQEIEKVAEVVSDAQNGNTRDKENQKEQQLPKKSVIQGQVSDKSSGFATVSTEKPSEDINQLSIKAAKLSAEDIKVMEVVAEIKKLKEQGSMVTNQEIEDLLKQAEKDILKQRLFNKTTRTVDANALLQDVEDELEKTFRAKVFDALRSSYETVKTAVAERNN